MNDITPFKTKTSKLGIDASEADDGTPVTHVESSIYSIRPETGSQNVARMPTELVDIERTYEDERPKPRTKRTASLAESNGTSTRNVGNEIPFQPMKRASGLDVIPVRAGLHKSEPLQVRFIIRRRDIEEHIGKKVDEDKVYRFKGTVEGVFDFDILRIVKKSLRIFVPIEHLHRVRLGAVYDIRMTSVERVLLDAAQREILRNSAGQHVPWKWIMHSIGQMKIDSSESLDSRDHASKLDKQESEASEFEERQRLENVGATFELKAFLHSAVYPKAYFRIKNSEYLEKTKTAIKEGAYYKLEITVEGVCKFEKKLRDVATRQDITLFVPRQFNSKVEIGRRYRVTIDSIETLPPKEDGWARESKSAIEWTWRDIADWMDTEGHIHSQAKGDTMPPLRKKKRK